ncbi:ADP-ribosyl-[dinitrogen reductase] glycohydrolase [Diplonema papillatum]|nr:ADP-ribosyl-[dinitrogen reductase] glycohydrolase [Diplonema papillatum]
MDEATVCRAFDPTDNFAQCRQGLHAGSSSLCTYDVVGGDRETYAAAARAVEAQRQRRRDGGAPCKQDKAMGCLVGNLIGDALGAPMEFASVRYGTDELRGMDDERLWRAAGHNAFSLKPGQWTDDGSMALCLADSLLVHRRAAPPRCGGAPSQDAPVVCGAAAAPAANGVLPSPAVRRGAAGSSWSDGNDACIVPVAACEVDKRENDAGDRSGEQDHVDEENHKRAGACIEVVDRKHEEDQNDVQFHIDEEDHKREEDPFHEANMHEEDQNDVQFHIDEEDHKCEEDQPDEQFHIDEEDYKCEAGHGGLLTFGARPTTDPVRSSLDDSGFAVTSAGAWHAPSYSRVADAVVAQWKQNERRWLGTGQDPEPYPASGLETEGTSARPLSLFANRDDATCSIFQQGASARPSSLFANREDATCSEYQQGTSALPSSLSANREDATCSEFPAADLMARFTCWNRYGYNNSFGRDVQRGYRSSVGLGGNISMAMSAFSSRGGAYTRAGTLETSGNGSVMRNGAVPCAFHDDAETAQAFGYRQSKTTHRGEEAAECCRLLSFVCCAFIRAGDDQEVGRGIQEPAALAAAVKFAVLDRLQDLGFHSDLYSIACLSRSEAEQPHPSNAHLQLCDRVWTWQRPGYRFAPLRSRLQPSYIGSYAMDALSMALHCVYTTSCFAEAALKAANLCGDADSVCAVTAQLAGSLYGLSDIPTSWVDRMQAWDGGSIVTRAFLLSSRERTLPAPPLSAAACRTATLVGVPVGGEDEHWGKMQADDEYRNAALGRAKPQAQLCWEMPARWFKRRGSSTSSSADDGDGGAVGASSFSSGSL